VKFKTLLSFDYGSKRIGIAVGQVITGTATPLSTINSYHDKPDWVSIEKLILEWLPDAIIVGIPLHMDGTSQAITEAAAKFARQLEARFNLPVFGMDERLSTFEAKNRSGLDTNLDSIAAQAILETWLAEHKNELENTDPELQNNNEKTD
jgi:putative holliday junction resolvase